VHVAVPDPDSALRAINRLRSHLPLLLALSANSPFWQGRETGLASARTPLFQAFPRVGRRSPVPDVLESVLEMCAPHAEDLGCLEELQWSRNLAATPRPVRQIDPARSPASCRAR
jgi:gamma-glutamyl:cysteine ligase YbdK (ATP-grasp superfamily)